MATANQDFFDLSLRHEIALRRLQAGEARKIRELIDKADAAIVTLLRDRLTRLGDSRSITSQRYRAMRDSILKLRADLMSDIRSTVRSDLSALVAAEVAFETKLLVETIPVKLELASVNLTQVRAAINAKPFSGGKDAARTLTQWFESVARADRVKIVEAVQLGVVTGETTDQIVRRVVGTRARGFKDGILQITRRNAETVVRTGVNHVSNAARESVLEANSDIIQGMRWVSTLDGRTSAICRGRDGAVVLFGEASLRVLPQGTRLLQPPGARPPAHPNCRSTMIAFFNIEGIADRLGDRPFVRDARTRQFREKDFRREARESDPARWKRLTPKQRNAEIARRRRAWTEANVGRVPARVTYDEWLRTQPASFQDEVLGKRKGAIFRQGKLHLDQFTDRAGHELTIAELLGAA